MSEPVKCLDCGEALSDLRHGVRVCEACRSWIEYRRALTPKTAIKPLVRKAVRGKAEAGTEEEQP